MFNDSKYTRWYRRIIDSSVGRRRKDGIYEGHHILPKSMGGSDDRSNIALLTPREHFICHLLLCRIVVSKRHQHAMLAAIWRMSYGKSRGISGKALKITAARWYDRIRKQCVQSQSERAKGDANPAKREDVRAKMRGSRPGQVRGPHSEERKEKIRAALIGRKLDTPETLAKKRASKTDLVWVHIPGGKNRLIKRDVAEALGPEWLPGRGRVKTR